MRDDGDPLCGNTDPGMMQALSRSQHHIDTNCVVGKYNAALLRLPENACNQQRMDIAMYRLDIAAGPARDLSNGQRTGTRHGADQFPAFRRHEPKQEFGGGEADPGALFAALERIERPAFDRIKFCDI